jgi:HTH-type transcriptional regulator, transcriptional repressor of NAD biosynthesis genes
MFQTNYVLEQARNFIKTNDFTVEDIVKIGRAQNLAVLEAEKESNKILFCDTDLITTQIYSDYYLNEIPEILYDLEKEIQYDAYFICDIDIPWVPDGLRDLGHKREEMLAIFKNELEKRNIPYTKVSGVWPQRVAIVLAEIERQFGLKPIV